MKAFHKTLTPKRWSAFSLAMQLVNIDTELARVASWRATHDTKQAKRSFQRALELLDLTVAVQFQAGRRRELARLREVITGIAYASEIYPISLDEVRKMLQPFTVLVARERGVG